MNNEKNETANFTFSLIWVYLGLGLFRRLCGGTRRLDRQCHPVLGRPVLVLAEAKKMVVSSILELELVLRHLAC